MARQSDQYTDQQLTDIYTRYAKMMGWSTHPLTVAGHISEWRTNGKGAVASAIEHFEAPPDSAKVTHQHCKVAGTNHKTPEGVPRWHFIAQCQRHEAVKLVREPDNSFDSNAIKVCRRDGGQLGYLPRDVAAQVVESLRTGVRYYAVVKSALNSGQNLRTGEPLFELHIWLIRAEREATKQEIREYVGSLP